MSENPFSAFTPKKEWLVCVDSDGCAMDTMDSKHHQAFCPQLIRVYGLEEYAGLITPHWMEVNLYSRWRRPLRPAAARACKKRWNGAAPSTRPSPPWAMIRGRFPAAERPWRRSMC